MPIAIKMAGKEIASYDTTTDKVAIKLSDDVSINDSAGNVVLGNSGLTSNVVFPALGNSAVGTVSESSGTPTGDIIERGSNANGEFVKYADGTMICFASQIVSPATSIGWGTALYRSSSTGAATWTYPAEFSSDPITTTGYGRYDRLAYIQGNVTTTSVSIGIISPNNSESSTVDCHAIGRWY